VDVKIGISFSATDELGCVNHNEIYPVIQIFGKVFDVDIL
jgi:hypothetical protein